MVVARSKCLLKQFYVYTKEEEVVIKESVYYKGEVKF